MIVQRPVHFSTSFPKKKKPLFSEIEIQTPTFCAKGSLFCFSLTLRTPSPISLTQTTYKGASKGIKNIKENKLKHVRNEIYLSHSLFSIIAPSLSVAPLY